MCYLFCSYLQREITSVSFTGKYLFVPGWKCWQQKRGKIPEPCTAEWPEKKLLSIWPTRQKYKFACKGSQAPAKLPITMDISLTALFLLASASILLPEARSWKWCHFRLIERNHLTTQKFKCNILIFNSYGLCQIFNVFDTFMAWLCFMSINHFF